MFRLVIGFWEFRFARVSCPRLRFREFLAKKTPGGPGTLCMNTAEEVLLAVLAIESTYGGGLSRWRPWWADTD